MTTHHKMWFESEYNCSFGSATRKSTRKLKSQITQICELRKLEFWERSNSLSNHSQNIGEISVDKISQQDHKPSAQ